MTALGLFAGERALVTGSASNIGRGIALALAREGAAVVLADIDMERNAAVAREIGSAGGSAETISVDLAQPRGWREIIEAVEGRLPQMLVHSACPRRLETDTPADVSEETWDAMLTTNVRSGFFLGRELGTRMRQAGLHGRMLYITSLHAHSPRNLAHYSAAKAGMTMVVKELARALGPSGIRVNALAPGAVPGGGAANMDDTFQPRRKIPLQRFGTPEDMAGMAVALLSDRFSGYVTGATVPVDGGLALFNWIDMPGQG
ncbi:MAG: SDR family oxidoreductase [Hyphomicrobiaceae bacterium]|nr:SDR family oxidoreductase [Hyphomicrobiaceae bacterium]